MQPPTPDTRRRSSPRRQLNRLLPILIIAAAGGYILVQEVPAVNRWYQQLTAPARLAATEACQRAALGAADRPETARLRQEGKVHETQDGYYIEGVEIGHMGADGAEASYRFSCYTDRDGRLLSGNREEEGVESE